MSKIKKIGWFIFFICIVELIFYTNIKILSQNSDHFIKYKIIEEKQDTIYHYNWMNEKIEKIEIYDADNKIGSSTYTVYPNEISYYNKIGLLERQEFCKKISENNTVRRCPSKIYECIEYEYKKLSDVKTKQSQYVLERSCSKNTLTMKKEIFYSEELCDGYDIKIINYNNQGNTESITYKDLLFEQIIEKILYIDGEYIKTKCFKNDSLGTKDEEYMNEKKHCVE
ncbi:MAG: hypothetical protein GX638_07325 [Crenarchaeota archaeon]|jgi:hypothetical protein|nr:hypothetical protein [Thermoproteota archaeon]